jgi:ABC-type sugar transport system substrate-binding protein
MRSTSRIVANAAVVAGALALGGLVQPAVAQQANQDHSNLPGYSARPEGMCWKRAFGSGNENSGYWDRCKNENQAAANARAQSQPQTSQRSRTRRR